MKYLLTIEEGSDTIQKLHNTRKNLEQHCDDLIEYEGYCAEDMIISEVSEKNVPSMKKIIAQNCV